MNYRLSADIFRELINGRVVNRTVLANDGAEQENPLFAELSSRVDDYQRQYRMSGYELVGGVDFFYIREVSAEPQHTELVKRIQSLLLIVSRHVTRSGAIFDKLTHPAGGISGEDVAAMEADELTAELLAALGIRTGLEAALKTNLVDRGIMRQTAAGRLILAPAGRAFFAELFAGDGEAEAGPA